MELELQLVFKIERTNIKYLHFLNFFDFRIAKPPKTFQLF